MGADYADGSCLAVVDSIGRGVEGPTRSRRKGHVVGQAKPQSLNPRPGDHRSIVRAELHRGHDEMQAGLSGQPRQSPPDRAIGGDSPGDNQSRRMSILRPKGAKAAAQAIYDDVDHRRLKGSANICNVSRSQWRDTLGLEPDCSFQS